MRESYKSAVGKFDLYYPFTERGIALLSHQGRLGMIVPNKLFHTNAASALRSLLVDTCHVVEIVDFGDEKLFQGATNYSCILLIDKAETGDIRYVKAKRNLVVGDSFMMPRGSLAAGPWHFGRADTRRLFARLTHVGQPLGDLAERFGTGAQSGLDSLLSLDPSNARSLKLEKALLRPVLRGRDVRRYRSTFEPRLLVFPYKTQQDRFVALTQGELSAYPKVAAYLQRAKTRLSGRIWFGRTAAQLSGEWYGLMYVDTPSSFDREQLLTPSLSDRANFTIGRGDLFATGTAGVTSVILSSDVEEDIRYLLGLVNSKLLSMFVIQHSPVFSGRYYKSSAPYLRPIPIRRLRLQQAHERQAHDRVVELVSRLLTLHAKQGAARTDHENEVIQRQIEATDCEIDQLVYELYGLTDEEIKIVEEATEAKR